MNAVQQRLTAARDQSACCCGSPLERRVRRLLESRGVPGVDYLQIDAEANTVLLRGAMPSAEAKRACLECCRHVAGVARLIDELQIMERIPQSTFSDAALS